MPILPPSTISPGKLALIYTHNIAGQTLQHRSSVNLQSGVDIGDVNALRTDAQELAAATSHVMFSSLTILAWRIETLGGVSLYEETFSSPLSGDHAGVTGFADYLSMTASFPGKGVPVSIVEGSGNTIYRIFIGKAYLPQPGQKFWTQDAAMIDLGNALTASLRYYCDYFGQKADWQGDVPCQFNAHVQRKYGT